MTLEIIFVDNNILSDYERRLLSPKALRYLTSPERAVWYTSSVRKEFLQYKVNRSEPFLFCFKEVQSPDIEDTVKAMNKRLLLGKTQHDVRHHLQATIAANETRYGNLTQNSGVAKIMKEIAVRSQVEEQEQ